MYSINGNFIIKERFPNGFSFDIDTEKIKQQSNEQGNSTINQESSSSKSGGTVRTEENKEVVRIEKESTTERTRDIITDISSIEETNEILKNQTKKMTDSYSISERGENPFNVFDSKIDTNTYPYYLPNTSSISFGEYLGIYLTFTTAESFNNEELLINFPSGYTTGITLYESKITPFIGMWWGSDTSQFLEFKDYIKKKFNQPDGNSTSISKKYDKKLDAGTIYRLFVEYILDIPGQTEIKVSLKNLSNGNIIYNRDTIILNDRNISGYSTNDQNIAIGQQVPWPNDSYLCKCNNFSGTINEIKITRRSNSLTPEQVEKLMQTGESNIKTDYSPDDEISFDIRVGATDNTNAEINIDNDITVNKIVFEYVSGHVNCTPGSSRYGCGENLIAIVLTTYDNKILLPSKKVKGYKRLDIDSAHWYTIDGIDNSSPKLVWDLNSPLELQSGLYKIWYCEDLSNWTLGDNNGVAKYKMKILSTKITKKSGCDILNKIANEPQIPYNCSKVPLGFSESGQVKCCKDEQTPVVDYFIDRNTAGKFDSGTHETIKTDSWEKCRLECKNNDNCLAYEFYTGNNDCALKKTWVSGSDDLNFFRIRNDTVCGGDCSKWYSGIKYFHKSTCEGNNRPKCALYGNPDLPKCDKCSDLIVTSLGLKCENCGYVGAFIGDRNLFKETIPNYGRMGTRGFSIIILDNKYNTKCTAQFDTHGDSNASFLMTTWLQENAPSNGFIIILVWDEAMYRLNSVHRDELYSKYKILGSNINLEYRSPYAAIIALKNGTSHVLQEKVYPPYTSPVVLNIKCFVPDNFPMVIYSNVPDDNILFDDPEKSPIFNSKRNFQAVRSLDEIYIKSEVLTPSQFSNWNVLTLYGGTSCCGGIFVGLHNGKVFLGNQCNENIVVGSKLENSKVYKLEFLYSKIMRKCTIWINSTIDVEKEDIDYNIPSGRLTIGSGCHDKDHEIWGYGTNVNCKDFDRIENICFSKPGITKELVKQEPIQLVGSSYLTLNKNNLLKEFDMSKDYKLDMIIHPTGKIYDWSNIIHATLSGSNCCGSKDRLPGIWFRSNTSRLHIRTSTMDIGNDGYDPNVELPLNRDTRLIVTVQGDSLKIELSGGVTFSHTHKISVNRYYGRVKFYASDPWYNASIGKIKNMTYENLLPGNNQGSACSFGNCQAVYDKCNTLGAHVTTKEELEIWKSQNQNPPKSYGITTTRKNIDNVTNHWLEGSGWHFDGCCGNDDRYYVCARSGIEIENTNNCIEGDAACYANKYALADAGKIVPPNTPAWKSGLINEIEIYNKYFSEFDPPVPESSTPEDTNLQNFEKDVKCEDLCDLGIQGNKEDSWLCKTSRPLSDLRCCKVNDGQWCPKASSIVNSEYGIVTLESSGSNRCCCGKVLVEEDIVDTSVRKEDREYSTDSTFESMKHTESIYKETSSKNVIYLDGNNEPTSTVTSIKVKPTNNKIIPNEETKIENNEETKIENNEETKIENNRNGFKQPVSNEKVIEKKEKQEEQSGGGINYVLIIILLLIVFYYLRK